VNQRYLQLAFKSIFHPALPQCRNSVVQQARRLVGQVPAIRSRAMNYHLPIHIKRAATAAAIMVSIAMATLCASSQQASADSYPSRRITFVVPYPAGGATDILARLLANKLQESWKQTVLVENKSGGGGVVGNDYVAKAQPDGYNVLVAITQIIQAPSLVAKLPYDVFKDLAPVTQIALSTIVLVVPEAQPIKSVKELVDYAKANPGKPYGTFGNATTSHLYGELLKKTAGINMTHIPYRGSAPLTNDLLANTVTAAFVDLTTANAQIKAGKLRPLAVGGEKRRTQLPDVPTLAELGYPGFEIEGWLGVFVPAGTPKDIVAKLSTELARIIASPEGVAGIEALSLIPVGGTAEAFDKALRRDLARWADVVKATGVKGD
jgi:tripartite-type tricarboxylate transporter receptor subunit TctC